MFDLPVNAYNLQFSLSSFPCGHHFSFTAAFRLSCISKISGACIRFIKLYSNLYAIGTNGTRVINICFIKLYSKRRKKETARTVSFFTYKYVSLYILFIRDPIFPSIQPRCWKWCQPLQPHQCCLLRQPLWSQQCCLLKQPLSQQCCLLKQLQSLHLYFLHL